MLPRCNQSCTPLYGLPIGGVLATENAVIPYAVGVDIACRMKMTVLDIPVRDLEQKPERLIKAIERETRFGMSASFRERRQHDVMDADWSVISAGLDEVPMAYKNIRDVMAAQKDLVTVLGEFMPKLVKMVPAGERAED